MKDYSTDYSGIKKIYFNKIILEIINIIKKHKHKNILDFGCGKKMLFKKITKNYRVINYDINPKYSDIKSIDGEKFDVVVINHVLMYFNFNDIDSLFKKFYKKNNKLRFIIGIGKQNLLSKFLMLITFNMNAHKNTKTNFINQLKYIEKNLNILHKKNIYNLTEIIYAEFTK